LIFEFIFWGCFNLIADFFKSRKQSSKNLFKLFRHHINANILGKAKQSLVNLANAFNFAPAYAVA